jgi:nucleoside-diphosphate-sugar epimerase
VKILITGCSGFIGKIVLQKAIQKYGADAIVALSSSVIEGVRTILHNNYHFNDTIFVDNNINDVDTLMHIGAFTPKDQLSANNIEKCNSNITSTQKLISLYLPNLKKIVYLSTIDVYETMDIITETTNEHPVSLYGYSKLYCEKMIQAFSEKYNLIYQILRIGHVFGPGEDAYKKIIPITIMRMFGNSNVQMYGDGSDIRTFIYIDDVADAILNSIDLNKSMGVINIAGEEQITIKNLIEKIAALNSTTINIDNMPSKQPRRNLIFNNAKMKNYLLSNLTKFDDGLKMEFDYMKERYTK